MLRRRPRRDRRRRRAPRRPLWHPPSRTPGRLRPRHTTDWRRRGRSRPRCLPRRTPRRLRSTTERLWGVAAPGVRTRSTLRHPHPSLAGTADSTRRRRPRARDPPPNPNLRTHTRWTHRDCVWTRRLLGVARLSADALAHRRGEPEDGWMSHEVLRGFSGQVAEYYARFRRGYPPEVVDALVDAFSLDHTDVAIDLGCGTGQLTLPLAQRVGAVVGSTPSPTCCASPRPQPEMRTCGRCRGCSGSTAICRRSRDCWARARSRRSPPQPRSTGWITPRCSQPPGPCCGTEAASQS